MFTQILDCTIIIGPAGGRALDHWNPRLSSISRGWGKMLPRHEARDAVYCLPKWEAVNVTLACLLLAEGWQDAVRQQLICRAPGRGGVRGLQDGSRPLREVRISKAILVEVPQAARGGGCLGHFGTCTAARGPVHGLGLCLPGNGVLLVASEKTSVLLLGAGWPRVAFRKPTKSSWAPQAWTTGLTLRTKWALCVSTSVAPGSATGSLTLPTQAQEFVLHFQAQTSPREAWLGHRPQERCQEDPETQRRARPWSPGPIPDRWLHVLSGGTGPGDVTALPIEDPVAVGLDRLV